MNVSIDCRSLLLTRALEKFLDGTIVEESEADILITDYRRESEIPLFFIGLEKDADLHKPFSRSQLMIRLEKKHEESIAMLSVDDEPEEKEETPSLEERIEALLKEYTDKLVTLVEEHHAKKG